MQPSVVLSLPSSHSSKLDPLTMPSPQPSFWQAASQPSPAVVLPSSQVSLPLLLMTRSPHFSFWHSVQPSPTVVLPSSQASPLVVSTIRLPQNGSWQSFSQPSSFTRLPSSHSSVATPPGALLTSSSPQYSRTQAS